MLDKYFSNYLYPILIIVSKLLIKFGYKANHITILGLIFSFLSFLLVIDHQYIFGLVVFLISRLMDGIDGIIANNTTVMRLNSSDTANHPPTGGNAPGIAPNKVFNGEILLSGV